MNKIRIIIDPHTGESPWSNLIRRSPDAPIEQMEITVLNETTGVQFGPAILRPVGTEPPIEPDPEPPVEPEPEPPVEPDPPVEPEPEPDPDPPVDPEPEPDPDPDPPPVVVPPPPSNGADLTPPNLFGALGPTVASSTAVAGWPPNYEVHLEAAFNRFVAEMASGDYTAIPDVPDGDNPHYGPLRAVVMRNIRRGLPLDESEPVFAAALKLTREWVRGYAIAQGNRLSLYRNTALTDCEIVYWLYKDDGGDNGLLATQCRQFIQVASAWLSTITAPSYENLDHGWMDSRPIALAVEAALAAERVGWGFNDVGPASYNPHGQRQYKPAGVTSWATYIEHVNGFIDRIQANVVSRFGGQTDPKGVPILSTPGNLRWAGVVPGSPYAWKVFMDAMLADALLKAARQHSNDHCIQNAIELATGVQQKYDTAVSSRKALPYNSHGSGSNYFYESDTDYALSNFWPKPLLILWQETGEQWYKDIAVGLLEGSCTGGGGVSNGNSNWLWRFKQMSQLASATEPQCCSALLAGVRWR